MLTAKVQSGNVARDSSSVRVKQEAKPAKVLMLPKPNTDQRNPLKTGKFTQDDFWPTLMIDMLV